MNLNFFAILFNACREQEKAETKDKKVLAILKEKDNNIKILEEVIIRTYF